MSSSIKFFISLPNNSEMVWDRYVTPFNYGLWLAVVITACAISVCLALTNCGRERNPNLSLSAILFYIHACFCRQGRIYKSCFLPLRFYTFCNPVTKFNFSVLLWLNLLSQFSVFFLPIHPWTRINNARQFERLSIYTSIFISLQRADW